MDRQWEEERSRSARWAERRKEVYQGRKRRKASCRTSPCPPQHQRITIAPWLWETAEQQKKKAASARSAKHASGSQGGGGAAAVAAASGRPRTAGPHSIRPQPPSEAPSSALSSRPVWRGGGKLKREEAVFKQSADGERRAVPSNTVRPAFSSRRLPLRRSHGTVDLMMG